MKDSSYFYPWVVVSTKSEIVGRYATKYDAVYAAQVAAKGCDDPLPNRFFVARIVGHCVPPKTALPEFVSDESVGE